jgi:short-subunit dehydrogenase
MRQADPARPFAVITGASRGIGAAYARALAARRYDLLLVARDRGRLTHLAQELTARHGIIAEYEVADLAQADAAHRLYAAARVRRAATDLLVNNAGFGSFGDFASQPMSRIQDMLRLHVVTIVEAVRLFLPGMLERGAGGIINVSSVAGLLPVPYLAEYAATKAFVISFTTALAEEVRDRGVRIQVCCPGSTKTDFHESAGFQPRNPAPSQSPDTVVALSLARLERNTPVVLTSWTGRGVAAATRLIPCRLLTRLAAAVMKRAQVGGGRWL